MACKRFVLAAFAALIIGIAANDPNPVDSASVEPPAPVSEEPPARIAEEPLAPIPEEPTNVPNPIEPPAPISKEPPARIAEDPTVVPDPVTEPTEPPTTVTTEVPTTTDVTTVAPLPPGPPQPSDGSWIVYDPVTNVSCIVARFGAAFKVPYARTDGMIGNGTVSLSPNATVTGSCGDVEQTMHLSWYQVAEGVKSPSPNELTLTFTRNITNNKYFASDVTLKAYTDLIYFPNASAPGYIVSSANGSNLDFFPARLNNSYSCHAEQNFYMPQTENGLNNESTYGSITKMQIQAFRLSYDDKFGTAENCEADRTTSDIVPIAVGLSLVALILIVCLTFLFARRRAAARRGYQTV